MMSFGLHLLTLLINIQLLLNVHMISPSESFLECSSQEYWKDIFGDAVKPTLLSDQRDRPQAPRRGGGGAARGLRLPDASLRGPGSEAFPHVHRQADHGAEEGFRRPE